MESSVEERFDAAMFEAYESWKRECRYNATRFLQMLRHRGGPESARRLLRQKSTSFGLEKLTRCRGLRLTVEYHVLKPDRLIAKGMRPEDLP